MENISILLAATNEGQTLRLRIDHNGLARPNFDPNPVENLVLESCQFPPDFLDVLGDSLQQMIEYQVVHLQDQTQVIFWFGYKDEEFEVLCGNFISDRTGYTLEELLHKCERLSESYCEERRRADVYSFLYRTLLDKIQSENLKGLDLCQRKIDFFAEREPEKAEHFRELQQVILKQLAITGLDHQDDHRRKIKELFSQIYEEDGIENHLVRNSEIRNEIVAMGDAAVFPLLEVLTSLEPSWRAEILILIERISPKIYTALQNRPDFFEGTHSR